MRSFDIYNAAKRSHKPVAQLHYDNRKGKLRICIAEDAAPANLPLMFALFAEQGKREVPDKWARKWLEERIPPQGRQNLGEILRANGLETYDEVALLEAAQGRSAQDDFLVRPTPNPSYEYAAVSLEEAPHSVCETIGYELAARRKALGLTQRDVSEITGIDQAAVSRIESGRANPTLDTLDTLAQAVGANLLIKLVD